MTEAEKLEAEIARAEAEFARYDFEARQTRDAFDVAIKLRGKVRTRLAALYARRRELEGGR